ncbi:hypothetical protein [uncultured Salinicola sp.]|uniref:hypothetical protein n=1 Tax=uncultured Salinicola sp. TaxID=1193542 RepID=UPI0026057ED8|nr:hypothetical protein [uncultured Salinicola sp.]|tara:strand:- start:143 stop:640 length:498 start_codon:yes stop_codon:yes gene_type:complete
MITIPQALLRYALGGPLLAVLCLSIGDHGNALGRAFVHGLQDLSVWLLPAVMFPPVIGSIGAMMARRRRLPVRLAYTILITVVIVFAIRSIFVQDLRPDGLVIAGLAGLVSVTGWMVDAVVTRWKRSRPRPAALIASALLTLTGLAWIGTGAIDTYRKAPPPAYI